MASLAMWLQDALRHHSSPAICVLDLDMLRKINSALKVRPFLSPLHSSTRAVYNVLQIQCSKRGMCAAMCYRCQGFGHSLKECLHPSSRSDVRTCVRCGQQSCKAGCQGDWYRFMEGCNRQYSKSDKKHVRCFVCGKTGHFCCKTTPEVSLLLHYLLLTAWRVACSCCSCSQRSSPPSCRCSPVIEHCAVALWMCSLSLSSQHGVQSLHPTSSPQCRNQLSPHAACAARRAIQGS